MVKRGEYGSNMIKVTLRFWTNYTNTTDKKVANESGVAYLNGNKFRGIKPQMERFWGFHNMPKAVIEVLKKGGVKLRPDADNYIDYGDLEAKMEKRK
jgi:hypothetical protein